MALRVWCLLASTMLTLTATEASAGMDVSIYGGVQGAPHSTVTTSDGTDFTAGWEGKSFAAPPYYGGRATWWLDDLDIPGWGVSLEFSHAKVYADEETFAKTPGWSVLEFTDGLNLVTINGLYRLESPGRAWTPYVGLGAGLNIPHVEVTRPSGKTFEYQVGGATLQAEAGIAYQFAEHWSVFTEYKGNYSFVNVDIDHGATLKTDIFTNAINVGLTYHW
ncbi:outer membrane protein [Ensifer soli]|uniref:outer membrane protein n=1 Tax=Ciceribacter sp. sgz301302 TaxID=3342379 RepID=UPI0035B9F7A0